MGRAGFGLPVGIPVPICDLLLLIELEGPLLGGGLLEAPPPEAGADPARFTGTEEVLEAAAPGLGFWLLELLLLLTGAVDLTLWTTPLEGVPIGLLLFCVTLLLPFGLLLFIVFVALVLLPLADLAKELFFTEAGFWTRGGGAALGSTVVFLAWIRIFFICPFGKEIWKENLL